MTAPNTASEMFKLLATKYGFDYLATPQPDWLTESGGKCTLHAFTVPMNKGYRTNFSGMLSVYEYSNCFELYGREDEFSLTGILNKVELWMKLTE